MRGGVEVILVSPEKRRMGSERGANSPARFMCPLRIPACQRVTKTENSSDLSIWAPPFFCVPIPTATSKTSPAFQILFDAGLFLPLSSANPVSGLCGRLRCAPRLIVFVKFCKLKSQIF